MIPALVAVLGQALVRVDAVRRYRARRTWALGLQESKLERLEDAYLAELSDE